MPTTETSYKCKKCGDEIPANTNKNLKACKCGALAVDGCADYVRVIDDQEDWTQWEAAGAGVRGLCGTIVTSKAARKGGFVMSD